MLPQKDLKSWSSEITFLVFWEDNFWLKCSLNWLSFLCLFIFAWQVLNFIIYLVPFLKFSAYQFQLSIICYVFLYKCHKNSLEKSKQMTVKIRIFPVLIVYWSGFRIFKQNQKNPDEIGMVGQSVWPSHHYEHIILAKPKSTESYSFLGKLLIWPRNYKEPP